jgi:peptidoglycan/xylan/chitin deacetylase (PgdA/CDA1 family)
MHLQLKLGVANLLDKLGILNALQRLRSTQGGLVLALHRVLPEAEMDSCYEPHVAMSEPVFRALLTLLRREYQVVSLQDLLAHPESVDQRQRVALTFDDGWIDTYQVAYPVLLHFEVPATVFVCTDFLKPGESPAILPEERFAQLWQFCSATQTLDALTNDFRMWGIGQTHSLEREVWGRLVKKLPLDAKLMMLTHLEDVYRVPHGRERKFLNWEEARIMQRNGITFGSHTMRHSTLATEQAPAMERELAGSKAALRTMLQTEGELLAFPNGSYDSRVLRAAQQQGFRYGFTTERGLVNRKSDPLAIPRVCLANPVLTGQKTTLHTSRTRLYLQRFSVTANKKAPEWTLSPDSRLA